LVKYPIGLAADPSGDFVYVVNSNFDLKFSHGSVVALDVDTHKLVPQTAVQVPSFGGELLLQPRGIGQSRLFLPARGNNSLTWMDVTNDSETNMPTINCWVEDPDDRQVCADHYVLDETTESSPGRDPFGVSVRTMDDTGLDYVFTTSFDGQLSVYEFAQDTVPKRMDQVFLSTGAYDTETHPITGHVYATSKRYNLLHNVAVTPGVGTDGESSVSTDLDSLYISNAAGIVGRHEFARSLVFNPSGTLAFVAYRTPPSLLVVDTAPDVNGKPNNRVVTWIPLAGLPSSVAMGAVGPNDQQYLYVTLYDLNQIAVVDPSSMEVIETIDTGEGPYNVVLVDRAMPALRRAYVSLFDEHAIGVIELDANSLFYHQEIARIRR